MLDIFLLGTLPHVEGSEQGDVVAAAAAGHVLVHILQALFVRRRKERLTERRAGSDGAQGVSNTAM